MGKIVNLTSGSLTVGCPDVDKVSVTFLCCGTVEMGADTVSATLSGGGLPAPLKGQATPTFTGQWQVSLGPVPLPASGKATCDLSIDSWSGGTAGTRRDHKPLTVTVVRDGAPACACASHGFFARLMLALGRCFRHFARSFGCYGGRPPRAAAGPG